MASRAKRRAAVVTVSDGVSSGVRDDASGRALVELLREHAFDVGPHEVVPDERDRISRVISDLTASGAALIVTTGGTGLGPRDVTPEATRAVIEREAPGLAEAMRAAGRASTPFAALSREVVGSIGSTLVVNLPGSRKGALESLSAILDVLPHALDLLAGETAHGPADVSPVPRRERTVDEELAPRRAAGDEVVLATAVRTEGDPPCKVGQKILLGRDGPIAGTLGCAEFDAAALHGARAVLDGGEPATQTYDHDLGSIEVYLEPTARRPLLVVFSATPVAATLVRWGREVGFEPVVVEPRTERLGVVGDAVRTRAEFDPQAEDLAGRDVFAVHTDHDAPGVAESVAALIRADARFVGVMGSARHVGPHLERLRELGLGDEELARVRTPVGLNVGARSAEEIALSILAGVVAARRGRDGGWLDA